MVYTFLIGLQPSLVRIGSCPSTFRQDWLTPHFICSKRRVSKLLLWPSPITQCCDRGKSAFLRGSRKGQSCNFAQHLRRRVKLRASSNHILDSYVDGRRDRGVCLVAFVLGMRCPQTRDWQTPIVSDVSHTQNLVLKGSTQNSRPHLAQTC